MANIINQSPLILDTVANNIVTGTIFIAKIRWVGGTTAGHAATITDSGGRVIWTSVAAGTNYVEIDTFPASHFLVCSGDVTAATGLCVTALQSGKLYVYLA